MNRGSVRPNCGSSPVRWWLIVIGAFAIAGAAAADTWRGLSVAPENRCSCYHKDRDYRHPPSVEPKIVEQQGGIFGPYTGRCFPSIEVTDIEHIVATSEAHDSGLCAEDREIRKQFARDLRNLTLASEKLNRHEKKGKDAAEWIPDRNRCWFAAKVVEVKLAYGLTVDKREAAALDTIFDECTSAEMERTVCNAPPPAGSEAASDEPDTTDALALYDDDGDARITCNEARRHGIAPVRRSHPAYQHMRDRDGDGVVCELMRGRHASGPASLFDSQDETPEGDSSARASPIPCPVAPSVASTVSNGERGCDASPRGHRPDHVTLPGEHAPTASPSRAGRGRPPPSPPVSGPVPIIGRAAPGAATACGAGIAPCAVSARCSWTCGKPNVLITRVQPKKCAGRWWPEEATGHFAASYTIRSVEYAEFAPACTSAGPSVRLS